MPGVLFVCHANLCRSPLAHAIMVRHLQRAGLEDRIEVDSAGTWADEGLLPHPQSVSVAEAHGISMSPAGRSRALVPEDLQRFGDVLVMDRANETDVARYRRLSAFGAVEGDHARIRLLRRVLDPDAVGAQADVPDPIGRGRTAYERVFAILDACCAALVRELEHRAG